MSEVKVSNLAKNFGKLKVIENMTFNVERGEFLCIVGPSGCGKTTLLKLVVGIEKPSEGMVLIEDQTPNPSRLNIGFVFQSESLFPWRNVWENVKLGLEIRMKTKIEEFNGRISEMLKLVGLSGFETYYPHQISGGMRKRAALARALAVNPSLLLMDEPFGDLDAQTRWILHKELLSIHRKLKKTIIFVTHNVEEAVFLADRVIVLSKRPATIKREMTINLEEPRNKLSVEFIEYREAIIALLREEVPEI